MQSTPLQTSHFVADKAAVIGRPINTTGRAKCRTVRPAGDARQSYDAPDPLFSPANHLTMKQIVSWRSLLVLLSLSVFDYGECQLYRRLRLVPPMNATALCPNVAGAGGDGYARTIWFFPNGSRIVNGERTAVDEAHGVLDVIDPENEDLGVYMCVSFKGSNVADADATLAFLEIYSAQRRKLTERLWIGGLASLCVLVTVVFVSLVIKFQYRKPPADKRGGATGVSEGVVNKRFQHEEMSTVF